MGQYKLINLVSILLLFIFMYRCAFQNYTSKGHRYLNQEKYKEAVIEFEKSLWIDTLPVSLSGLSRANLGLNKHVEAKKFLILLKNKFPYHKFIPIQIEIWNNKFPDDKIE